MSKNKQWDCDPVAPPVPSLDELANGYTYIQYYNRLCELSMSMFEWTGLPDTCDKRYLELTLFRMGQAVFFKDDVMGFLGLPVAGSGTLDLYQVPTRRRAYADNGYNHELDESNSVIIFNNYMRTNSMLDVRMFSARLADLDRTIDINVKAQKCPVLILCDEKERNSYIRMYQKWMGNEPMIIGSKALSMDNVKTIDTTAPYVGDRLYELKTQIWNEALTYLGIPNISNEKQERMVRDEVARNQGGTFASRYSRLNARQEGCEKINRMFGLNVWCEYKDMSKELGVEFRSSETVEEGGEDGE